jgi:prefoldin subunit 5
MDKFSKQFEGWAATYRAMKKQVDDFDRLADRIDRRLNEVAEVQRLSEERFRHEWEEFLQEDQKRWRQFTLTSEEARREQQRSQDDLQAAINRLGEQVQAHLEHLKSLRASQQDALRGLTATIQSLREQSESSSLPPLG